MDHGQTIGGGRLDRTVGLPGVFAICTGAMSSSGFFLLPGPAADETGPPLPRVYLAAGVSVLPAGSLVALIRRAGLTIVPDGDECFEDGDRVTSLVEASAIDRVKELVG